MATYYKYAERDASNQVNWAEISSNMVNSLNEAQAIRESKKQAINDATAELSTTLSEAPQGEHRGLNEFAMTYANNAQQMRLMQDQLLKSGQLKLKDYNIGRANLTQGTTQLFNLGKKYQAVYSERMKKFQDGTTSQLDADMLSRLEGFANFSNHEAYINPTNGQVSVGKLVDKEVDGKTVKTMDRTPGSFTTVQQLNFSLSQEILKYQLDGLDAEVDKIANNFVKTFGPNFSIDDVRQMEDFPLMVNDMVQSQVQIPNGVASILKDYVGGFKTVFNKEEQDENSILMIEDPSQPGSGKMIMDVTSEMGKKQKTKAEEFLRRHIDKQLSRKETKTQPRETRDYTERNNRYKEEDYQISNVGLLMTGDETQVQTVIDYFRDLNEATKKVIRTPNGIEVTFKNNEGILETRDISFYVGEGKKKKAKTVAQFIESASNLLTGKSDDGIRTILERGNYDKDATFNEKLTEDYIAEVNVSEDEAKFNVSFDTFVNKKVEEAIKLYGDDDEKLIPSLFKNDKEFSKLGAIAVDTGSNTYDISIPGIDKVFKVTQKNIRTKLPIIIRAVYKQLKLDQELRNKLSKMTDAQKIEWEKNNPGSKIKDILKSDKREDKGKTDNKRKFN